MSRRRLVWLGATLAALSLVVVGGVAVAGGGAGARPESAASRASSRPFDLRFIDDMTMHHRGAIMSAQMMIADSRRPELRDLARRIVSSQKRQIGVMQAWRKKWYPRAKRSSMDMSGMDMGSMGMSSMGMRSDRAGGDMTDRMFLRMMVPHHQMAVDMSREALSRAQHPQLKLLAREIISGQSAEIVEMEGYLKRWYGDRSTRNLARPMRSMMMGQGMGGMDGRRGAGSMPGMPQP